ncbi:MAG: HNH endonuclease [Chloroflexi bacterium]|nr:HNH endonuclease [Chloroflexota bacterium]
MTRRPSLGQNANQAPNHRANRSGSPSWPKGQPTLGAGQDQSSQAKAPSRKQPARHPIPTHLRFEVLRRDNFRCCFCGANAKEGVELQIDHKIPVSRGGTNDPHNLQTLCQACNLGKSSQLL